jgi:hypothetical protein
MTSLFFLLNRRHMADRRDFHDDANNRKQHVGKFLDHVEDQGAAAAEAMQCKAEQQREQQLLPDLPLGEGIDDGGRNDIPMNS